MRGSSSRKTNKREKEDDEVEQLLQAAQDQFLLNLSLNSHTTRSSLSPSLYPPSTQDDDISLDLDLERRFRALKGKTPAQDKDHQQLKSVLGDDLAARFAALKGKSSSQVSLGVGPTASKEGYAYEEESEDEVDQVRKLIEWAKDAARLHPSPPSDVEDEDGGNACDSDNDNSSASDADNDNPRGKRK
ncbi:hypothetical protein RIF29_14648 [Crotalaria pallida]|uniref:Uncharacterized protein n=1 Tax=Crotalaria pallida TaxID=3830 RepID=A0AAN9IBU8_CROPI